MTLFSIKASFPVQRLLLRNLYTDKGAPSCSSKTGGGWTCYLSNLTHTQTEICNSRVQETGVPTGNPNYSLCPPPPHLAHNPNLTKMMRLSQKVRFLWTIPPDPMAINHSPLPKCKSVCLLWYIEGGGRKKNRALQRWQTNYELHLNDALGTSD